MAVVLVHGGAANIDSKTKDMKSGGVKYACQLAYTAIVKNNASALDAVEMAVRSMEDDPWFNAGFGSSLTIEGTVEMDAIIMEGKNLRSGSVAGVSRLKNPISVARKVMERTEHCLLMGEGAENFASKVGFPLVKNESLIHNQAKERLKSFKQLNSIKVIDQKGEHDTVGAVALDLNGNLAVATSTGGLTGQLCGRIGDSPLIGSGGWADNETVAVSTTGQGESIMRICLAKHISSLVERGYPIQKAVEEGLQLMKRKVGGEGGVISLNCQGEVGIYFTTNCMPWALMKDDKLSYGISLNNKTNILNGNSFTE